MTRLHNLPRTLACRRRLRAEATPAERLLWRQLKQARDACGVTVRRQHGIGPFVVDFYVPRARLCIELDGGVHDRPDVAAHDAARQAWLEAAGYRVVRVPNAAVRADGAKVADRLMDHVRQAREGASGA